MSIGTQPAPSALDQRVELDISGMTCAACASRIEKKLNKMEGVSATVNYATERAVVLGLAAERAPEAVAVVEKAGYGASEVRDGQDAEGYTDRVKMLRNRLIVAALLTVPLGDVAIVLALAPQMRFPGWQWVLLITALPVVFWCAWPFHKAAWRNLRHGTTSMIASLVAAHPADLLRQAFPPPSGADTRCDDDLDRSLFEQAVSAYQNAMMAATAELA